MTSPPEWGIIALEKSGARRSTAGPDLSYLKRVTVVLAGSGYFFVLLMRAINRGMMIAKTIIIIDNVS